MFVSSASGPFADHYASTLPGGGGVTLRPRRRVTRPAHRATACIDFDAADQFYQDCHYDWHECWDAQTLDPHLSGYDHFMSQALWLLHLGFYFPDLPVHGDGSSPILAMPGAGLQPNVPTVLNIECKTLTGTVRMETRLTLEGYLEYRYRHWFSDPRNVDPNFVMVAVHAFWDFRTYQHVFNLEGNVDLRYDTGWVNTHIYWASLKLEGTGFYLHELLHQEINLVMNTSVKVPQRPATPDHVVVAAQAPIVRVFRRHVVRRSLLDSLYGDVNWEVLRIRQRSFYVWYTIRVHVAIRARPSYRSQIGFIRLRAIYDKVNFQYTYKLFGRLRKVIREHPLPRGQVSLYDLSFIARVSNPHDLAVQLVLTYDGMTVALNPLKGENTTFDTARHPVVVVD